nr:zinc knuckle CX2CX4HX4C [Tanacetum cinerariifolium]
MNDGTDDSQQGACSHAKDCDGGEKLDNGVHAHVEVEKVVFGSVDDTMFVGNDGSKRMNISSASHSTPIAMNNMSYVKATNKLVNLIENKLINIHTDTDDGGNEFVVFDEELDIHMEIDNTQPDKLPLWVRFCNPPLEALTVKGISALASRIGKPLIMDARTTSMCNQSVGKIGYARVLIEISANKGLPDKIDISCPKRSNVMNTTENGKAQVGIRKLDEFTEVINKKKVSKQNTIRGNIPQDKQQNNNINGGGLKSSKNLYQPKKSSVNINERSDGDKSVVTPKTNNFQDAQVGTENKKGDTSKKGSGKRDKHGITTENDKMSANKYYVLENLDEEDEMVRKPKGDKMKSRKLDDN